MPFVRIDLSIATPEPLALAIGDQVFAAMIATLDVPPDDKFQVITRHAAGGLVHTSSYLGVTYSPALVFIQITLSGGRTIEKKRAFYRQVADGLHTQLGLRREDLLINLVEVAKENWSFGNGEMQYGPPPG